MSPRRSRRQFLQTAAALQASLGLSELEFLRTLQPVAAAESELRTDRVQLSPEIEPLVRLIEDTPREQLLETIGGRLRHGLTYQQLLAALLLAGVRNVEPRPVGFKFHSVLVVNSAHLASLASPDAYRWLPIFWALDYFKRTQADQQKQHPWALEPVDDTELPSAAKSREAFIAAMENWDEPATDAAIARLARTGGEQEIYELFYRFGARDFRSIGHKAIYVANSRRTLECIGWQHAEPVLRSLAFALLSHEGDNPAKRDGDADRDWRKNVERAKQLNPDWAAGRTDAEATRSLLDVLRSGTSDEASEKVVELSRSGIGPQSLWDAVFVGAAELLPRQRGIVALHAVTTANALHYAYQASSSDDTRRMMLLQAAAFVCQFRQAMHERGKVGDTRLDKLEPIEPTKSATDATAEILTDIGQDRMRAARKVVAYASSHPDPTQLLEAARVLVFFKGDDAHDYKFSSAALEDYRSVSPAWRPYYLAGCVHWLRGAGGTDNPIVKRTEAALKG